MTKLAFVGVFAKTIITTSDVLFIKL